MSISTHVLDAAAGRPAAGVGLRLRGPDRTVTGTTDADGRCALVPADVEPGDYELVFATGDYFGGATFYPSVTVTFTVTDGRAHHHVPLLLSPWSYTTYRGS